VIFRDIVCFRNLVDGNPALVILTKINENAKRVVCESGETHDDLFAPRMSPPQTC
jgi:hypothetical protein